MRGRRVSFLFLRGACICAGSLFFCRAVSAADPSAPVRFVSWNVRNYLHTAEAPRQAADRATKPKPPEEIAAVTGILTALKPDIAGLCEVGGPRDLAALQERLKAAGLDLPHVELVEAADRDRHLVLLSKFPIVARRSQTGLSYLLDESRLPVQRGFLDVTLQITPSYQLRCIGAHLKSRREVPLADEALMRRNEAHLLSRYAGSILAADPAVNLLVYGDFNSNRGEPALQDIAGGSGGNPQPLTALTPQDARGERWTFYFPEDDTYSRIDFLFASRGLLAEVDDSKSSIYSGSDWLQASDHRALSTIFLPRDATLPNLPPPTPPPPEESESEDR